MPLNRFVFESGATDFKADVNTLMRVIESELTSIGINVAREAERRAQEGLERSVYGTAPGHVYKRTGTLKRGVSAQFLPRVNSISIQLVSKAPYSSNIEYGQLPTIAQLALEKYAELTGGRVITFGRTGLKYRLPGPFLMPATVYALERAKAEFEQALIKNWR